MLVAKSMQKEKFLAKLKNKMQKEKKKKKKHIIVWKILVEIPISPY